MRRSWYIIGGVFLCVLVIGGGILLSANSSRVVMVNDQKAKTASSTPPAETTTTDETAANSATSSTAMDDTSDSGDGSVLGVAYSTSSLFSLDPVDATTYNAKLLSIANLPVIVRTVRISSTTTMTVTSTVSNGWPVKGNPLPDAGALLPFKRIVAYYGNLYSKQMGVLGQYPPAQMLAMLASTSAQWATADPSTPVVPALDYIVVSAQASPGPDGKYRDRMPDSQIDEIMSMAQQINGLVFLDIQVGLSSVEAEVPLLEKYLAMPNVELSLDPEFDMHNGERPGTVIGTMDASDINFAANYLASLVKQYNLPPKILVVHRFTQDMVTHTASIQPLPSVQVVMDMDGFGYQAKKINTYQAVIESEPVQFTGFKLFYKNDQLTPGSSVMTPAEVLKLTPQPSYIQYQ